VLYPLKKLLKIFYFLPFKNRVLI